MGWGWETEGVKKKEVEEEEEEGRRAKSLTHLRQRPHEPFARSGAHEDTASRASDSPSQFSCREKKTECGTSSGLR